METKLRIIFYSMYGHIYKMTQAVAEGAQTVSGVKVELFRIPELIPEEILEKSGAKEAQKNYAHIPVIKANQITNADAYIFGTPTRFGGMSSPMRNFLNQLGECGIKNAFAGKVGSVFTSMHHGNHETITHFHTALFGLGMIIVGKPDSKNTSLSSNTNSLHSISTIINDMKRTPTENELAMAHHQGKHVAEVAHALKQGRREILC